MGRLLIMLGAVMLFAGLLITLAERFHIRFGRLPGDIVYRGKNTVLYFPWVTCLLISVILSVVLWLVRRR